jgi:mannopine transport system ATP-binding protein
LIGQALTLRGIRKRYKENLAVNDVSIDIDAGEFVSILGPSGSGKTTLLTMIAGFESPCAGQIAIGGRDITPQAPNRRNIGLVFQRYALFPHMTVGQNVAFPLRMRGIGRAPTRDRVKGALELVQLGAYEDRYPDQLSGGQQQRVAVARALVFEPPVLLMDEPLGALDKNLREAMQFEIKRLQSKLGATVIYVTHDQDEALTMSDRIAVMANGNLVQIGRPTDIYQSPVSPFVADFIGRMNFIDCEYLGSEGCEGVVLLAEGLTLKTPLPGPIDQAKIKAGMAVRLAIRPERMSLVQAGSDGAIPGRVETRIFVGSFQLFLVRIKSRGNPLVQIKIAATGEMPVADAGDEVGIRAQTAAIHIFPGQGGQ